MKTSGLGWVGDGFVRGAFVEGPLERLTTFSACTHAYTKFGFPTSPHVHVVGLWEEDGPSEESGERSGNGWPLDMSDQMNSILAVCDKKRLCVSAGDNACSASPTVLAKVEARHSLPVWSLVNPQWTLIFLWAWKLLKLEFFSADVQKFTLGISSKWPAVCSSIRMLAPSRTQA